MSDVSPPAPPTETAGEFTARVTSSDQFVPGKTHLTDEAMGWLAYLDRKTTLNETWFKEEVMHEAWDNKTQPPIMPYYRYDLTYATYALGLMAENTPAWREQYGKILGYMSDRFLEYHAMWDWIECSGPDPKRAEYPPETAFIFPEGYFGKYDMPGWAANGIEPYQYDPDPVRGNGVCNLMYKGYLNLVLGFYNYITGDAKYDTDFKVRYDADTVYTYNHGSLNELIANQFRANISGLGCEVVKVYPWCMNLTGMAQKLYDIMHGTNYVSSYNGWKRYFRENFVNDGYGNGPIDTLTLYFDPTIPANLNSGEHQIDYNYYCNSVHLAGLDHGLSRRLWEGAKPQFLRYQPDGSAFSIGLRGMDGAYLMGTLCAATAAKVHNDDETFEALNSYIQNEYQPTWDADRGEFYFGFALGEDWPRGQMNDWLMPAYTITRPGQWQDMFTKPNTEKFRLPTLEGVDYPALRVRQATSDENAFYGSFTTVDRSRLGDPTSYRITKLVPGVRYQVAISGSPTSEATADSSGAITVDAKLAPHTLVVRRVS